VSSSLQLAKVLDHLRLYDHPLLVFSARETNGAIEVLINLKDAAIRNLKDAPGSNPKDAAVDAHTYVFPVHARDLDSPQFAWQLQRQLYDALHDYFIEMFTRTPQSNKLQEEPKNSP